LWTQVVRNLGHPANNSAENRNTHTNRERIFRNNSLVSVVIVSESLLLMDINGTHQTALRPVRILKCHIQGSGQGLESLASG
jgi:hypothetical protein